MSYQKGPGQTVVIALGGNALGNTPQEQLELVKNTAEHIVDMVAEGILMPLGALVMTILIGWVLKPEVVQLECEQSGVKYRAAGYFKVCFKFIVPVLLAFILFCQLIDFFGLKIPGLS